MQRKLVKQGKGALTVSIPRKWIEDNKLEAGDVINFHEDDKNLIISSDEKFKIKKTTINLKPDTPETYRSLIGGLYRGGYDEIKVIFSNPNNLSHLQKAVNSLYGFEIFDIHKNSCIIKNIYQGTATDIKSHILKMIHIINTLQAEVIEDINFKKNELEIAELRNNTLKQRDIVIRLIHKQKLVSNEHLPNYTIAMSLWSVSRNYFIMYNNSHRKIRDIDIKILEDTAEYFKVSFSKMRMNLNDFVVRNERYKKIRKRTIKLLQNDPSRVLSHCMNIILSIQLADSSLYLLNHKN